MENLLHCGRYFLNFDRPLLMGIVNLTDDSLSGDGFGGDSVRAIEHGLRLKDEGAHILDIGAESSRPGAQPVSADRELATLLPVIDGLRACGLPLSVDTTKPQVMRAAIRRCDELRLYVHGDVRQARQRQRKTCTERGHQDGRDLSGETGVRATKDARRHQAGMARWTAARKRAPGTGVEVQAASPFSPLTAHPDEPAQG